MEVPEALLTQPAPPCHILNLNDDCLALIFSMCDEVTLRTVDATAQKFRAVNRCKALWRVMGAKKFKGIELEECGTFEQPLGTRPVSTSGNVVVSTNPTPSGRKRRKMEINWKRRYHHFSNEVYEFRAPWNPWSITAVLHPNVVAYTKCRLLRQQDILQQANPNEVASFYLEVAVAVNADNLSLALVDCDGGGKNSVTFSPEHGTVIKEMKVQESPCRFKNSYIQPLNPISEKFVGKMGMYVHNGYIAFFRQYQLGSWESTGFCVDLSWAKGKRLAPCLTFRDEGKYLARIFKVSTQPPVELHFDAHSFGEFKWDELNWGSGGREIVLTY